MGKEIKTKKELLEIINKIPIKDEDHKKRIVCSLIGCSRISTVCFGYRNCARCGAQLGDSLGGIDPGKPECVIVDHNCKTCRKNYKKCTWKDKFLVGNPFTKKIKKKENGRRNKKKI